MTTIDVNELKSRELSSNRMESLSRIYIELLEQRKSTATIKHSMFALEVQEQLCKHSCLKWIINQFCIFGLHLKLWRPPFTAYVLHSSMYQTVSCHQLYIVAYKEGWPGKEDAAQHGICLENFIALNWLNTGMMSTTSSNWSHVQRYSVSLVPSGAVFHVNRNWC